RIDFVPPKDIKEMPVNTSPRRSAVNTNDMLGLLMRDLDRYPMPNYDEQVELAKRVTAGDEEAKKQMVAANLRLVLHWPVATNTVASRWSTSSKKAPSDSCVRSKSSTGNGASSSPRTRPGGFAKPSSAPSNSTDGPFESHSKSANSCSALKRPPPS